MLLSQKVSKTKRTTTKRQQTTCLLTCLLRSHLWQDAFVKNMQQFNGYTTDSHIVVTASKRAVAGSKS